MKKIRSTIVAKSGCEGDNSGDENTWLKIRLAGQASEVVQSPVETDYSVSKVRFRALELCTDLETPESPTTDTYNIIVTRGTSK